MASNPQPHSASAFRTGACAALWGALLICAPLHAWMPWLLQPFWLVLVLFCLIAIGGGLLASLGQKARLEPTPLVLALGLGGCAETAWFLGHPASSHIALAGVFLITAAAGYGAIRWFLARFSGGGGHAPWIALGLAVLASLFSGHQRSQPVRDGDGPRVVVVGLDGATFRVLDRLNKAGQAPNFARLAQEGRSGPLESIEYMLSPRVWTTIATGKTPAEHGIPGFGEIQNEHLSAMRIWEVLARDRNSPALLFQWLVTWPPDRLPEGSVIVPGWMSRGPDTIPANLSFLKITEMAYQKGTGLPFQALVSNGLRSLGAGVSLGSAAKTMREVLSYKVGAHSGDKEYRYARNKVAQMWTNGDIFLELHRRADYPWSSITFYGSDTLSHKYWKYYEPEGFDKAPERVALFEDLIPEYYRGVDAFLGRLMEQLGENTTLFLISDHGFMSGGGKQESGYTILNEPFLQALNLPGSRAFTVANYVVVNPGEGVSFDQVQEALETFRLPQTDEALFIVERQDQGVRAKVHPLVLDNSFRGRERLTWTVATPGGEFRVGDLIGYDLRSGVHEREGVLYAWGAGIEPSGGERLAASVYDLMPTWLRLLDLPMAEDIPGRVLTDWMTPEARARAEQGPTVPTLDIDHDRWRASVETQAQAVQDINALLYDLGYLQGG